MGLFAQRLQVNEIPVKRQFVGQPHASWLANSFMLFLGRKQFQSIYLLYHVFTNLMIS